VSLKEFQFNGRHPILLKEHKRKMSFSIKNNHLFSSLLKHSYMIWLIKATIGLQTQNFKVKYIY